MSETKRIIAYIEQKFPGLTTTFIYREVFALQKRNFKIITFSIHRPDLDELSTEARPLIKSTYYIVGTAWYVIAWAHLYFLFTKPLRYLSTLYFILSRHYETLGDRRRTMLHFMGAVYFASIAKKQKVQHIHAHFAILSTTISMVVSRLLGITYSFTAHNTCFSERILLPEKITRAHFIAAISNYTRSFLIDQVPERQGVQEKIHIIRCGIPVNDFSPPVDSTENIIPTILSVAQLREYKGMFYLIKSCHLLKKQGLSFRCLIIGDGPEYDRLADLISELMLADQVKLLGRVFQEDLKDYLHQTDIFAMACIHMDGGFVDGIPVSLMEAMATEIPCVSTTVSGIPDLIDHGINGLLVEQRDTTAFADALQTLLQDQKLRQTMGKAARKKVVDEFNIEKTSAQMADLIEHQIARIPPG